MDVMRADLSDRVAEEIRSWMGRRRISGAALARALGVSPAWVSYRLSGVQEIGLNDLQRIAAVLDVEAVDLMPRSSEGRVVAGLGSGGLNVGSGVTNGRSGAAALRLRRSSSRMNAKPRRLTRHPIGRPEAGSAISNAAGSPSQRRPGLVTHRSRS